MKDLSCSPTERVNSVKMAILPKTTHTVSGISNNTTTPLFTEMGQGEGSLQIYMEAQNTQIIKVILKERNKTGGIAIGDFKTYDIVIVKN